MADGLCIGSPGLVGGRKAGNSNMQDFFAPRRTREGIICNQVLPPNGQGQDGVGGGSADPNLFLVTSKLHP